MNGRLHYHTNSVLPETVTAVQTGILQRKCLSCDNHTVAGGNCEDCKSKQDAQARLSSKRLQANSTDGQLNDVLEQNAAQTAEQIVNPAKNSHIEKDKFAAAPKKLSRVGALSGEISGKGQNLPVSARRFLEPRFGYDFSHIKVHTDNRSAAIADILHARAFTYGSNIFFGKGEYAPQTAQGRQLLAHELTHVVQQQSHAGVQRQEIPDELLTSVDLGQIPDEDLRARYDLISSTLKQFDISTPETAMLEEEAGKISNELARREALASGRTFSAESIEKMKTYFIKNAKKAEPDSCIACLNQGIRLLLDDKSQKMGSEVDKSMGKLEESGRAGTGRIIEFEDKRNRITTGTLYPNKLHESVWDALIQMAGGDVGWSVFGMSLMDGYHSVTLTLDRNAPSQPRVYWSDQWSSKDGWKEYNKTSLDAEITKLIQGWWNGQPENRKHNTRVTVWRLNQ